MRASLSFDCIIHIVELILNNLKIVKSPGYFRELREFLEWPDIFEISHTPLPIIRSHESFASEGYDKCLSFIRSSVLSLLFSIFLTPFLLLFTGLSILLLFAVQSRDKLAPLPPLSLLSRSPETKSDRPYYGVIITCIFVNSPSPKDKGGGYEEADKSQGEI